jgi:cytochrome o ubiquinol oxidase subunit 2
MRLKADQGRPAISRKPARSHRVTTIIHLTCLGLGALSLAGCSIGILAPVGPVGEADKTILIDSVIIMLAIVLPTIAATLLFAWWFRASNTRARYLPTFAYSGQIEMVVWSIPILVVLLLSGVAWIGSHDLDPAKSLSSTKKPLEVQVVSLDWKWLFLYPQQGVASLNKLVVPKGVPLHLSLTSASVMNVFFVPQLGSMIYTMNGMSMNLNLQADKIGVYNGLSANYSGDGFSGMRFDVDVVDQDAFDQWIKTGANSTSVLDTKAYRGMLKQSIGDPPKVFKLADPSLYQAIVTQMLPPGEGPKEGRPNPSVSPRIGDENVR